MLEYTGRGKSIIDVGLAQARYPLDTTNHYFEIEIVDPGEKLLHCDRPGETSKCGKS